MKVEPVAWATEDGRVSMAKTRDTCMPNAIKGSFTIPLYDHAIPPGYALVRVEPTEAMMDAAEKLYYAPPDHCADNEHGVRDLLAAIHKAMLTAAKGE